MNPFEDKTPLNIPMGNNIIIGAQQFQDLSKSGIITSKINLLALDIATNTGFCSKTASGSWNLTPKKDESKGMRLIRFRAKLKEICELEHINLIVFEQLANYSKFPNFVGAEMQGILKLYCEENKIEYRSYAPTVIKKFGTGSGAAKKRKMIEAAKKYKSTVESDDEADAIILYHLALQDLFIDDSTIQADH